jgi:hypothetical protein
MILALDIKQYLNERTRFAVVFIYNLIDRYGIHSPFFCQLVRNFRSGSP